MSIWQNGKMSCARDHLNIEAFSYVPWAFGRRKKAVKRPPWSTGMALQLLPAVIQLNLTVAAATPCSRLRKIATAGENLNLKITNHIQTNPIAISRCRWEPVS